jgi:heme exporter protein A
MEISVNSATCYKNNVAIFNDINLSLKNGDVALISGANGSGKTTLIKSISGIQNLESGAILLNNIDISHRDSDFVENIIYIGHKNSLNSDMTVHENLVYLMALDSSSKIKDYSRIEKAMNYFDIQKYKDYFVSDLSEGNKKKTSLARLIISDKKIWILDEPLSNLDNFSIEIFIKLIIENQKNNGISILSSHYDISKKISNVKRLEM